jgi:hypothetical protein
VDTVSGNDKPAHVTVGSKMASDAVSTVEITSPALASVLVSPLLELRQYDRVGAVKSNNPNKTNKQKPRTTGG